MALVIVVEDFAAPVARGQGGQAMRVLHLLRGLERLGHEVLFLEFVDSPPDELSIGYFRETMDRLWDLGRAALISEQPLSSSCGLDLDTVSGYARRAAVVVTIAAHYRRRFWPLLEEIRPRILFEQDPGYTHLWAAESDPADIFGLHDLYFTVGANVGTGRSSLPTCGIRWHALWNPVVLDWWSANRAPTRDRFTTIADWRGYGYLDFEGQILGPKSEEFRKFIDLPDRIGEPIELVLSIDPDDPDLDELSHRGWLIEKPEIVSTPEEYRSYVSHSLGEFSCAKGGYVGTRSGWFSDRSACYLAAGRPVVAQATGFEDHLPTGAGLFAVSSPEEAAEAIEMVRRDYALHSAAAREIAEVHFDSDRILATMLHDAGVH